MGALQQLVRELVDHVSADTLFSQARQLEDASYVTIPAFSLEDNDLQQQLQMAAALGIGLYMELKRATPKFSDQFGPYFDDIVIQVDVDEDITLNRGSVDAPSPSGTLIPASEVMERAWGILHHFTPQSISRPITAQPFENLELDWSEGQLRRKFRGTLTTGSGLTYTLPKVATPALVNNAGTITITCATAGAAIFYTIDGRNPVPRSGTLYTAPFASAGQTVRAKAWLAGYQASDAVTLQT